MRGNKQDGGLWGLLAAGLLGFCLLTRIPMENLLETAGLWKEALAAEHFSYLPLLRPLGLDIGYTCLCGLLFYLRFPSALVQGLIFVRSAFSGYMLGFWVLVCGRIGLLAGLSVGLFGYAALLLVLWFLSMSLQSSGGQKHHRPAVFRAVLVTALGLSVRIVSMAALWSRLYGVLKFYF